MAVLTFLGRPLPSMPPRRLAVLLGGIAIFAIVTLVFTLPSSIPAGPSLSRFTDSHMKLPNPNRWNPFKDLAHQPPVQSNSTNGETSWYSNWNWRRPFSSSVTLDENRSLLPPLADRPAIYTYYDHTLKKDSATKAAENDILITWRRAWWAQGFKPVILGPAEAMQNPLFEEMQKLNLEPALQTELSRWLAWENMGTGLLCNYLALPMGPHEDPLLKYLRRGEYPKLTRFEGLGSGLFTGEKAAITAALKAALKSPELAKSKDFIGAVTPETFEVDPVHEAIAFYDSTTVTNKYAKVAEEIVSSGPKGLNSLNKLMNGHLHNTWQNIFSDGIAVLKPIRTHTTAMVEPALQLATYLSQCPDSSMLATCPPNRPKCKPCVASTPMKVSSPAYYSNRSTLYTIGTVPHPYTLASLSTFRDTLDIRYIRRESQRDQWIMTATKELMGTGLSSSPRVLRFKEAVASDYGSAHTLWVIAEKSLPSDLDWHFGFAIPKEATDNGKSETPVPGPERRPAPPAPDPRDGPVPTAMDLERERILLEKARQVGKSKEAGIVKIRDAIEAWNLADTEAWKFARAFAGRSRVERLKWEEEEKRFAGGAGAERGKSEGWGRWFDSD
jgi:hypothetical protein